MKVLRLIHLTLLFALTLSACGAAPATQTNGTPSAPIIKNPFAQDTPTPLPTAQARITPAPDAQASANQYLAALQNDDYESMYALLTQTSQAAVSLEQFSKRYADALNAMSAGSFEYLIQSAQVSPAYSEVAYQVIYHTALAGDIQRSILMRLNNENGAWKVVWDDALILPELAGGNQLAMEYSTPARGNIYDRNGKPIVAQSDAFAFGIQTEQINYETINTLTNELGKLCGYDPQYINDRIEALGAGWYLPMCEGTREEATRLLSINPGGLVISNYNSRYYFETGLAPQAVGYTLSIPPEDVNEYRRRGYDGSEKVGRAGIELWAEEYLAGKHGGILRVVSPQGQIVATLGQSAPQPADEVYLTIDENMQYYAQKSIEYFRGAVVVIEVKTGRILALASAPDFDPNLFEPSNPNNPSGLPDLLNNGTQPLLNRATQGQYPLGSAFKTITMAAALESGLYLKDTTYDCQYEFKELPDRVLYDWTYEHCQQALAAGKFCEDSSTRPSGLLTLQEGLMRSCNPYFWHIGLDLYSFDRQADIAKMARAFGLGAPTGIEQIAEAAGQINDPVTPVDSVNQAIGQGDMLVTPLQVATFMAAIANGGTLYRPQIVEKIQPIEGAPKLTFTPEARGTLPVRAENLQIMREALFMVTQNSKGTARLNIRGMQFDVAGKTGTAESGNGKSHAWFTGFTDNETDTTLPDIAIAVIVENIGEGSEYAVPIFRAMVETYYYGSPQRRFYDFGPIGEPPYTPTP